MNGNREHSINTSSDRLGGVSSVPEALNNSRCGKCNKLLFKGEVKKDYIEIKCRRCGYINLFGSLSK